MKFDTKRNAGNAGLSMAIAYFGSNGNTVSIPLNDTQDYDLIADIGGYLKKVQVKATNTMRTKNAYSLSLRSVSGTTRKSYKTVEDTDVDLLFCLCGDGTMYLIPVSVLGNSSSISLCKEKSKYSRDDDVDYSKYIVHI